MTGFGEGPEGCVLDNTRMREIALHGGTLRGSGEGKATLLLGTRGTFRADAAWCAAAKVAAVESAAMRPPEMERVIAPMVAEAVQQLHRRVPREQCWFGGAAVPLEGLADGLGERMGEMLTLVVALEACDDVLDEPRLRRAVTTLTPLLRGVVADWVSATATLLERMHRDGGRLAAWLGVEEGVVVARMEETSSDAHPGGHRVVRIEFAGGGCVYYKPRAVTGEWLWHGLLGSVAGAVRGLGLPAAAVLAGGSGSYGWMRSVGGADDGDGGDDGGGDGGGEAYWRVAGAALCLARQVGLSDLHVGNVMATAKGPAVTDAECLGAPEERRWRRGGAAVEEGSLEAEVAGLVATGLLPCGGLGEGPDVSGLFGRETEVRGVGVPRWVMEQDGRCRVVIAPAVLVDHGNAAGAKSVLTVLPQVLEGYRAAAAGMMECRRELLRTGSGWRRVLEREHAPRVVVRETFGYARLISGSLEAGVVGSAGRRREMLMSGLRGAGAVRLPQALVRREMRALLELQLPRFVLLPGTRTLASGSGRQIVRGFVEANAAEMVVGRIEALSEEHVDGVEVPAVLAVALRG